jgi:hypothetical protein
LLITPNVFQGGDLNTAIDIGVNADNSTLVKWGINTVAMNVNWDKPILGHALDGNTTFHKSENVIHLEKADEVRNSPLLLPSPATQPPVGIVRSHPREAR